MGVGRSHGVGEGVQIFCWLIGVVVIIPKTFLFLYHPFPGPLATDIKLFLVLVFSSVPIGSSELEVSAGPCLGYMREAIKKPREFPCCCQVCHLLEIGYLLSTFQSSYAWLLRVPRVS